MLKGGKSERGGEESSWNKQENWIISSQDVEENCEHGSLKENVKSHLQKKKGFRNNVQEILACTFLSEWQLPYVQLVLKFVAHWAIDSKQYLLSYFLPYLGFALNFLETILPHSVQSIMPRFCCIRIFLTLKKAVKEIQIKIMAGTKKESSQKSMRKCCLSGRSF